MLNRMLLFYLTFVVFNYYHFYCVSTNPLNQADQCPDYEVTENITDPFVEQKLKRAVIHDILTSPMMSNPSSHASMLLKILSDMSRADSFHFTDITFQMALWSASLLAQSDHIYPSFCPFARVINKTAEWQETGNKNKYVETVRETVDAVSFAFSVLKHASLTQLGCQDIPQPMKRPKNCWQNGLVSRKKDVWRVFGRLLPCSLREVVINMSVSPLFSDRAYATLMAFVLTPAQNHFFTNHSYSLLLESAYWYTKASSNSKCCCEIWEQKLDVLNDIHTLSAQELAEEEINSFLDDKCKDGEKEDSDSDSNDRNCVGCEDDSVYKI